MLGSGAGLAVIGTLLTTRTGRQRDFDSRLDKELKYLREREIELEAEVDRLRTEVERLRLVLVREGIEPETP